MTDEKPALVPAAVLADSDFEDEFELWWNETGQFVSAGGGAYEKSFAFEAWRFLFPKIRNGLHEEAVPVLIEALTALSRNELDAQRSKAVADEALATFKKLQGG